MPALIRVGHKGADAIVPGNTLASFDAAAAVGVDMIEFDVLSEHGDGSGELFVAHDEHMLRRRGVPTLERALEHLSGASFDGIRLQLDVKRRGYERRMLDMLRAHGLLERAFVSTGLERVLAEVRSLEPAVSIGWTVPYAPGVTASRAVAVTFGRRSLRALAIEAPQRIRDGRIDAVVVHWRAVSRALIAAVHDAGGESYVWTVDRRRMIRRLAALGVTGVITNDPRLFEGLRPRP
jgi:glycerophosphoryl diester phosphodiesterase